MACWKSVWCFQPTDSGEKLFWLRATLSAFRGTRRSMNIMRHSQKKKKERKTLQAFNPDFATHVPPGFHLRNSLCGMPWLLTSQSDTFPPLLITMADTYKTFSMTSLQEVATRKRDVYPLVCETHCHWQPTAELRVTTFPLKVNVCPQRRRALNCRGSVQRQESADECCKKRFKCQQTVFLACWEECGPL